MRRRTGKGIMMNIVAFSDTHGKHKEMEIVPADVLIFAGDADICNKETFVDFVEWFGHQPAKHKLFVAGNHDVWLDANYDGRFRAHGTPFDHAFVEKTFKKNKVLWLQDSNVIINNVKFHGSAITPEFCGWAFMRDRAEIHEHWDLIPMDTQILITHGPAWGLGDDIPSWNKGSCGCKALRMRMNELPMLTTHIHGHLHTGNCTDKQKNWNHYNVSVVDEGYTLVNDATVIV